MKTKIVRLSQSLLLLFVMVGWPALSNAQVDFSSWTRKMQIHFTGYNRTETLTNFPALVVLGPNSGGFNYTNFLSGTNADLRFTDSSQTNPVNYEIEKWDTNGSSYVWVQVPFLTNGASIWAFWGKSGQSVPVYATNGAAWTANYFGVWHLATTNGTAVNAFDSTMSNAPGVVSGATATNAVADGGGFFVAANSNYVDVASSNVGNFNRQYFSVSGWIRTTNSSAGFLASKGNGYTTPPICGWGCSLSGGKAGIACKPGYSTSTIRSNLADGVWHHYSANLYYDTANSNNNAASICIDGGLEAVTNIMGDTADGVVNVRLGCRSFPDGSRVSFWDGSLDEIRISTVARSTNWVWAEWLNMATNSVFSSNDVGVGGIQTDSPANVTATSASLAGTLTSTGFYDTAVLVFYGPTDGGTNVSNWAANTNLAAPQSLGAKSVTVPLDTGRSYFYRYAASNAVGLVWATNSQSLTALVDFSSWTKRALIQFPGYNRTETLTNFPALVVLGPNGGGFNYTNFLSGTNADLRFTDSSQTNQLNYEIEQWNTNGSSYVWVQTPFLTNGASLWAFWGKSGQTAPVYATNGATWSGGFEAVWHMRENATPYVDSALKHNITAGVTPVLTAGGRIGAGQLFDGTNNYLLTGAINLGNQFTLSAWVNVDSTATNIQTVLANKVGGNGADGFALNVNTWSTADKSLQLETGNGVDAGNKGTAGNLVTYSAWHHLAAVMDRANSNATLYVDGIYKTAGTVRSDFGNNKPVCIGSYSNAPMFPFKGIMDEVRIDTVLRSSNWVWACTMNQASNNIFSASDMGFAAIQTDPPTNVMATSATLDGTLSSTGFYNTAVFVFYGPADGGTNVSNWATNTSLAAPQSVGAKSVTVPVDTGRAYFYRYAASNAVGLVWATNSQSFTTPVDFTPWAKQVQIQFPGYNRAETLTNFPALVVLGTNISGFSYADFFSGSNADLRFTDVTQTNQLNYEIEKWDTNGSSYVWVQVPFLTNGASIWAFWGRIGQTVPTCTTNGATWSGNFESVWHLKESASPYVDSVLKHNATNGVAPVQTVNGKIGAGQTFDGTNNYLVTGAINLGNQFTMSAWVNVAGAATNIQTVLASKGGGTADGFAFYVNSWTTSDKILAFETANGSLSGSGGTAANVVTYSVWHHVAAVIDRANSNSTLYVDGVQKGGGTIRSDFGNNKPVYIGQFFGDVLRFNGVLDEVRIDTVLRSSNWVWACAMNQASNSLFSSNSVVVAGTVADVRSDPPSNVTGTSASLNGTLMTTGISATAVFVYYGPTDYGTNAASWATNASLAAPQGVGAKSMSVTVPAGGEIYYRYAASNAAGLVWAPGSQYFITTNVAISVTPAMVGEANASATFWFVRPVTATSGAVTVNFTLGGTASNGLDYSSMTASNVTLAPGVTNASLSVTTLPDGVLEGNETLVLTETAGAYVLNTPATTTLTIVDTPTVGTLAPTGVTASSANLNGSVNSATDTAVYVYYGPVNGGTNRASWATVDSSLVAPQAAGTKSVPVSVAANSEFYYRYAASNAGGLVWAPSSQYFITTNIAISVTPTVIGETNAVATFHFSRPVTVTGSTVTVNFMIGGTASNGADYSLISATNVTLTAGIASATLTVTSLMDTNIEGNESVDLIETTGAYVLNSPATTTLTITDSTVAVWSATTNTLVLQQGVQIALNGLVYGNTYTNAVDTYYDQANPNTSYGSSSTVSCCRYSLNDARRGYLRFDNLQGYVPTNAVIISARIELTGAGDGPGSYGGSIYYGASSWSPASTWNTRPDTTGDQVIGSMDPGIWFTWPAEVVHGIDVSAEAQGWLQGTIANNGITFRSPENSDITERNFYSSEYATVSKRPKLTLTYALNTAQVSPVGYERFSPITRTVVMLSGSNTIQDTYVDGDNKTANNVSAATVNLRTAGGQGVKRALLKINTSSGLLSTFANSAAPTNHLDKRLVSARLRIAALGGTIEDTANGLLLWTCNQSWNPATATFNTRDGSTPWSDVWTNGTAQNVGIQLGSFPLLSNPLEGGCGYVDITSTLQAWINGSNNNGLVMGYLSDNYDSYIALSENGVTELRPTLIVEYYDVPPPVGAVYTIR